MESFEIEIAPIHDVKRPRLRNQFVEDVDIVQFSVADIDERGDVAPQVQESMELDGALGFSKVCPRKHGKA